MGATTEVEVGVTEDRTETPLTVSLDATQDADELELFSQSIKVTLDEGGGQLSKAQTNRRDELSIPREIISSTVSSSIFQSECLRPILAGTYRGAPAYLIRLQFQLVADAGGNNRGWLSRIKGATIKVLLQDAPAPSSPGGRDHPDSGSDEDTDDEGDEPRHPSIVKTMPGPDGWRGQPTTARVEERAECGLQLGWDAAGVSTTLSRQRTKTETGAVRINAVCKGRDRNSLIVAVAEDAVDAAGIPEYLVLPLIVTPAPQKQRGRGGGERGRRFSMRVEVHARFGFWRHGVLAEMVPVMGRADEPLYFDPEVLHQWMEEGRRGVGGNKVVEWLGELQGVNLGQHFSLTGLGQTFA